jgi:hypothetical protein
MLQSELLEYHQLITSKSFEILKQKSTDYSCSLDTLDNFKTISKLGIALTEVGLMCRILDKFNRISTFIKVKEYQVAEESIKDTIIDSINYLIILYCVLKEQKDVAD